MNIIRSISIIAVIAIAVPVFSAQAVEVKGASQRIAEENARLGKVPTVDKTHNGGLFAAFGYFTGVIPDDVYVLEDVGERCDESGAPDKRSPRRCKRYVSDKKGVTFVIRFAPTEHLTFYYENKGGKQILVPYTRYNNGTYQMSFMSGKAEQFASAHGLGIEVTVASTSPPEVVAAPTKCDNLFEPLKGACLRTLGK